MSNVHYATSKDVRTAISGDSSTSVAVGASLPRSMPASNVLNRNNALEELQKFAAGIHLSKDEQREWAKQSHGHAGAFLLSELFTDSQAINDLVLRIKSPGREDKSACAQAAQDSLDILMSSLPLDDAGKVHLAYQIEQGARLAIGPKKILLATGAAELLAVGDHPFSSQAERALVRAVFHAQDPFLSEQVLSHQRLSQLASSLMLSCTITDAVMAKKINQLYKGQSNLTTEWLSTVINQSSTSTKAADLMERLNRINHKTDLIYLLEPLVSQITSPNDAARGLLVLNSLSDNVELRDKALPHTQWLAYVFVQGLNSPDHPAIKALGPSIAASTQSLIVEEALKLAQPAPKAKLLLQTGIIRDDAQQKVLLSSLINFSAPSTSQPNSDDGLSTADAFELVINSKLTSNNQQLLLTTADEEKAIAILSSEEALINLSYETKQLLAQRIVSRSKSRELLSLGNHLGGGATRHLAGLLRFDDNPTGLLASPKAAKAMDDDTQAILAPLGIKGPAAKDLMLAHADLKDAARAILATQLSATDSFDTFYHAQEKQISLDSPTQKNLLANIPDADKHFQLFKDGLLNSSLHLREARKISDENQASVLLLQVGTRLPNGPYHLHHLAQEQLASVIRRPLLARNTARPFQYFGNNIDPKREEPLYRPAYEKLYDTANKFFPKFPKGQPLSFSDQKHRIDMVEERIKDPKLLSTYALKLFEEGIIRDHDLQDYLGRLITNSDDTVLALMTENVYAKVAHDMVKTNIKDETAATALLLSDVLTPATVQRHLVCNVIQSIYHFQTLYESGHLIDDMALRRAESELGIVRLRQPAQNLARQNSVPIHRSSSTAALPHLSSLIDSSSAPVSSEAIFAASSPDSLAQSPPPRPRKISKQRPLAEGLPLTMQQDLAERLFSKTEILETKRALAKELTHQTVIESVMRDSRHLDDFVRANVATRIRNPELVLTLLGKGLSVLVQANIITGLPTLDYLNRAVPLVENGKIHHTGLTVLNRRWAMFHKAAGLPFTPLTPPAPSTPAEAGTGSTQIDVTIRGPLANQAYKSPTLAAGIGFQPADFAPVRSDDLQIRAFRREYKHLFRSLTGKRRSKALATADRLVDQSMVEALLKTSGLETTVRNRVACRARPPLAKKLLIEGVQTYLQPTLSARVISSDIAEIRASGRVIEKNAIFNLQEIENGKTLKFRHAPPTSEQVETFETGVPSVAPNLRNHASARALVSMPLAAPVSTEPLSPPQFVSLITQLLSPSISDEKKKEIAASTLTNESDIERVMFTPHIHPFLLAHISRNLAYGSPMVKKILLRGAPSFAQISLVRRLPEHDFKEVQDSNRLTETSARQLLEKYILGHPRRIMRLSAPNLTPINEPVPSPLAIPRPVSPYVPAIDGSGADMLLSQLTNPRIDHQTKIKLASQPLTDDVIHTILFAQIHDKYRIIIAKQIPPTSPLIKELLLGHPTKLVQRALVPKLAPSDLKEVFDSKLVDDAFANHQLQNYLNGGRRQLLKSSSMPRTARTASQSQWSSPSAPSTIFTPTSVPAVAPESLTFAEQKKQTKAIHTSHQARNLIMGGQITYPLLMDKVVAHLKTKSDVEAVLPHLPLIRSDISRSRIFNLCLNWGIAVPPELSIANRGPVSTVPTTSAVSSPATTPNTTSSGISNIKAISIPIPSAPAHSTIEEIQPSTPARPVIEDVQPAVPTTTPAVPSQMPAVSPQAPATATDVPVSPSQRIADLLSTIPLPEPQQIGMVDLLESGSQAILVLRANLITESSAISTLIDKVTPEQAGWLVEDYMYNSLVLDSGVINLAMARARSGRRRAS